MVRDAVLSEPVSAYISLFNRENSAKNDDIGMVLAPVEVQAPD